MSTRVFVTCFLAFAAFAVGGGCSDDSDSKSDTGVVVDASPDGVAADASADSAAPDAAVDTTTADTTTADTTTAPSGIGRVCKDDTGCESGEVCLNATKTPSLPGGYCSRRCSATAGCGAKAVCGKIGGRQLCLATCTKDGDCRKGYACEASLADFSPSGAKICVPGDRAAKLGDPCSDASECAPGNGVCLTDSKDGYCSAVCDPKVSGSCGSGGECVAYANVPFGGLCAKTCTQDTDCRNAVGYACATSFAGVAATGKVCAAGTRGALHGAACTSNSDCAPGVGVCLEEALQGMPGGYCSALCDPKATTSTCGTGAQCVDVPEVKGLCLDNCGTGDTCRTGYACVDKFAGVPVTGTVCAPGQTQTATVIGAACSPSAGCSAGTQACMPESKQYPVPGGYCTALCRVGGAPACPTGSTCVGDADGGNCFATCQSDADCTSLRASGSKGTYACVRRFGNGTLVGGSGKICSAVKAAARVGDPCVNGADCSGELGRCIFDNNPATASRYPNGYCTLDCDPKATADTCGTGAVCHAVSKGSSLGGSCVKTCTADTDCRSAEGYGCKASSKGPKACLP